MKSIKKLFAVVALIMGCFMFSQNVSAEAQISFNGSAAPFGGYYQKFFNEEMEGLNGRPVYYAKVDVTAKDGNKLKVSYLHTTTYISAAKEVASTDTLKASDNTYTIYFIPVNMSCPGSICVTVPAQYSTDGKGNNMGYDFMTGVRFTNESWFYGTLHVSGRITLY